MYDARKTELHAQQKKIEDDHLQILKTQAEHDTVDFRQKMLHDKQGLEKQLLQEVLLRYIYLFLLLLLLLLLSLLLLLLFTPVNVFIDIRICCLLYFFVHLHCYPLAVNYQSIFSWSIYSCHHHPIPMSPSSHTHVTIISYPCHHHLVPMSPSSHTSVTIIPYPCHHHLIPMSPSTHIHVTIVLSI